MLSAIACFLYKLACGHTAHEVQTHKHTHTEGRKENYKTFTIINTKKKNELEVYGTIVIETARMLLSYLNI